MNCLRCKQPMDPQAESCPNCGERITLFQRTYASRLLDGKYQIVDRLGVGGMGEIFKVRHIHLNELRVIKIMRPNVAQDDQGLQRFLQEARTSTLIKHRNLAMLYDFAQLEDGSYYMVWEFIDGTNIQKWIAANGPVPPRLAVEIAIQALEGLDHLHSMGLIHRDVSPENIMLSQDRNGKLLVKVIDFGIAKQLAEGDAGHGLTQTGMFLGKLKYASPEQAGFLKEGEHIDARSDLYSFGIVMYEMLAGRAPFQATNPHGYILKHVTEKPAPIRSFNENVNVPPQLESLIMKSLEKERDRRFESAAEFAAALESIRSSISPDEKYGLGERMITLSSAQTLADLPKYTPGTGSGPQPGGTRPGSTVPGSTIRDVRGTNEPTEIDRRPSEPTAAGSNEPTVVERMGTSSAAPTAAERGWTAPRTEAETPLPGAALPPPKSRALLVASVSAVVVILILAGVFWMRRGGSQPSLATSGTEITTTTSAPDRPMPTGNQGLLLLSASPWGELDRIVSTADQKEVPLTDELRSTPARIALDPGQYRVTVNGPDGKKTIDVEIEAGKPTTRNVPMSGVDFDALTEELTNKQ